MCLCVFGIIVIRFIQTQIQIFYHLLTTNLFPIINIPYIYTIESSLFGYQKESDFRITQYQPQDYR